MNLTPAVLEDFGAFCDHFGIALFAHQREDFGIALRREGGRFAHRVAGISWPRGDGKTWGAAAAGLWRLLCGGPGPQDLVSVALDVEGAQVVLDHARAILRSRNDLEEAVKVQASSLHVPATGSRWTVESREHTSTRGRHPDLVLYDECGWARDDELFASLLAGQASVSDPLMLVTSTVGRRKSGPLWTVKTLAEGGDETVCWRWSGVNRSPKVTREFLERQRRILLPAQFAREHQNAWVDAADSYTTAVEVDEAMSKGREWPAGRTDVDAVAFVDLGTVRDPSVIAVGYADGADVVLGRLVTFQGSAEHPVQLADVERTLRVLAAEWRLRQIRIESWQGVSAVQSLQRAGLPVELFAPTAKAHAEEWPILAQRLATRTLVLFPHARLREELLNLVYEVGSTGIRVIDRGRVHQDHAVALRGVVAMLAARAQRSQSGMFDFHTGRPITAEDTAFARWMV
jgi:phage terminase large subunit-like protein